MKYYCFIIMLLLSIGCNKAKEISSVNSENWSKRAIDISNKKDTLEYGMSYLSTYSQIYSMNEKSIYNLTSMVSLRNLSTTDSIYLLNARYYNTQGELVRAYFNNTIYLKPLETTEIIIDEIDVSGGTGSNFIFEWKTPKDCPEPLFEGVMTSTAGQQGFSFTTQAKRIK